MNWEEQIDKIKHLIESDPSTFAFCVREWDVVERAGLRDLAWALARDDSYATPNDARGLLEMLEAYIAKQDQTMPKIFLYCIPTGRAVIGYALAEDGVCLASHLSSSEQWSKHDLGLTSTWKHADYEVHYPGGFELEWVDDPDNHVAFSVAFALNQQSAKQEPDYANS